MCTLPCKTSSLLTFSCQAHIQKNWANNFDLARGLLYVLYFLFDFTLSVWDKLGCVHDKAWRLVPGKDCGWAASNFLWPWRPFDGEIVWIKTKQNLGPLLDDLVLISAKLICNSAYFMINVFLLAVMQCHIFKIYYIFFKIKLWELEKSQCLNIVIHFFCCCLVCIKLMNAVLLYVKMFLKRKTSEQIKLFCFNKQILKGVSFNKLHFISQSWMWTNEVQCTYNKNKIMITVQLFCWAANDSFTKLKEKKEGGGKGVETYKLPVQIP